MSCECRTLAESVGTARGTRQRAAATLGKLSGLAKDERHERELRDLSLSAQKGGLAGKAGGAVRLAASPEDAEEGAAAD